MFPIEKSNRKEFCLFLLKIAVTATIFVAVLLHFHELKNIDVRALVAAAPSFWAAVFTVFGIYSLKGLVFVIPAMLVYVSVGMAFSPLTAVLINLGGLLFELTVSYLFGLFLGGNRIRKFLLSKKNGKKILEMDRGKKYTSLFIMRLVPAFPIDFVSLFLGSTKEKFLPYLLVSFLGIAPRVVLLTVLGDKIYDLIPMKLIIICILIAVAVAIVFFICQFFWRQKKKGASASEVPNAKQ